MYYDISFLCNLLSIFILLSRKMDNLELKLQKVRFGGADSTISENLWRFDYETHSS